MANSISGKGEYQEFPDQFRREGMEMLRGLSKFQALYEAPDTDTAINQIRDALVGHYLGFGLLNTEKHGFDAKRKGIDEYLEIKQCSLSAKTLGGTWNDTNIEKARAFADPRLFTAVAVWKLAADLQFIVFGQNILLGHYLEERVRRRKEGSRSTQNVNITKLITEYGFKVICPPEREKAEVVQQLAEYSRTLARFELAHAVIGLHELDMPDANNTGREE